jgi:hypothetical protein
MTGFEDTQQLPKAEHSWMVDVEWMGVWFRDLLLAGRVQRGIMPAAPAAPGYEFFAYYQPVYAVGGDYDDFVHLPHDRLGIVVGDVAGKGVQAAMMMAQFASETRHRVRLAPATGRHPTLTDSSGSMTLRSCSSPSASACWSSGRAGSPTARQATPSPWSAGRTAG